LYFHRDPSWRQGIVGQDFINPCLRPFLDPPDSFIPVSSQKRDIF
jgi:hypothetical protein